LPMRLRPATAIALGLASAGAVLGIAFARRSVTPQPPCGSGFTREGVRCEIRGAFCPPPFERVSSDCLPPDRRVPIAAATIVVGPSDWEAEGRTEPRTLRVSPFRIDAFEITRGLWVRGSENPLRAASGMTREEAAEFCERRGGRLPTEDEWTAAAASASSPPPRYPWGDTGAVCRRAAWGLEHGPCGTGATGPDTVGAHGDGDTALGLHDLAGNVAEWVQADPTRPGVAVAKGGSWRTALASDLRVWARLELRLGARATDVGARCAYPP
jgi:sulfatase modifying factor 1